MMMEYVAVVPIDGHVTHFRLDDTHDRLHRSNKLKHFFFLFCSKFSFSIDFILFRAKSLTFHFDCSVLLFFGGGFVIFFSLFVTLSLQPLGIHKMFWYFYTFLFLESLCHLRICFSPVGFFRSHFIVFCRCVRYPLKSITFFLVENSVFFLRFRRFKNSRKKIDFVSHTINTCLPLLQNRNRALYCMSWRGGTSVIWNPCERNATISQNDRRKDCEATKFEYSVCQFHVAVFLFVRYDICDIGIHVLCITNGDDGRYDVNDNMNEHTPSSSASNLLPHAIHSRH